MPKKLIPYLLLLPQIGLIGMFLFSLISGMVQSFGIIPVFGLTEPTFNYYRSIIEQKDMAAAVGFSLFIAGTSAVLSTVIGTGICMLMTHTHKTRGFIMHCVRIPIFVPHTVAALCVINIFAETGLLARVLYAAGLISGKEALVPLIFDQWGIGIVLAYLWKEVPFIIYFVISLMANINGSLGEAAVNLGAGSIRTFFSVILPLCTRQILRGFIIIFLFSFGAYELPQLLGPTTPKTVPVLAYLHYTHPDLQHRPYAMALNGVIIIIAVICAALYFISDVSYEKEH